MIERMRDVMVSRGPDACGLYVAPGIGLGHRRLSIIDLSPAGQQPMPNEDNTVHVVFNGEIYNFHDLRTQLVAAGHCFRSRTDTEVLIHGYEEWGAEELLRRVDGMFAFALWDSHARHLLLARDRVGKKPLFYADLGNLLYFSSDIKSMWIVASDRLTIDPRAIDEFLYFYFINQDRTIYREVKKVPPAGFLVADAGGVRMGSYWTLDFTRKEEASEVEWLERTQAALRRAVARRMIADVPLGAFLSGGVDSSLVVAFMSEVSSRPVKTFSIGTGLGRYDELEYARQVATRYQTDHQEFVVEPNAWEMLPQLVWHYGEPFGDSSAVPSYFLSHMARQGVTVALSGDGGDEAFAGYPSYPAIHRSERWWWLPRWLRRVVLEPLGHELHARWPESHLAARLRAFAANMSGDLLQALHRDHGWDNPHRARLYTDAFKQRLGAWHPIDAQRRHLEPPRWTSYSDGWRSLVISTTLPSDYLVKIDVASMMSSLEVRCPFLDTEVLELTARMPIDLLLGPRNESKHLLKRLALKHLPEAVVLRSKKGFELPIAEWLRGPWHAAVRRILLAPEALSRGYFNRDYVERVLRRHAEGADHRHRLWCLLWLELWHLMFVDKSLRPTDSLPIR